MKKIAGMLLCALFICHAYSLAGNVITVAGKVEMQEQNGAWKPVKVGMSIPLQAVISTGFKSETAIQVGASVVTVKALTRMTLQNLSESARTVATDLYVEVGSVSANVKSLNDKPNDFKVRTPAATASVRGTVFTVSAQKGVSIQEGSVALTALSGQTRTGTQGDSVTQTDSGTTRPAVIAATSQTIAAAPDVTPSANEMRNSTKVQAPGSQAVTKIDASGLGTGSINVIITLSQPW